MESAPYLAGVESDPRHHGEDPQWWFEDAEWTQIRLHDPADRPVPLECQELQGGLPQRLPTDPHGVRRLPFDLEAQRADLALRRLERVIEGLAEAALLT